MSSKGFSKLRNPWGQLVKQNTVYESKVSVRGPNEKTGDVLATGEDLFLASEKRLYLSKHSFLYRN